MKKILSLFGTLALTSSSITVAISATKTNENINKKESVINSSNESLNWDDISLTLDDYFNSFEENNNSNINTLSINTNEQEMLNISRENSNNYLEKFKNENASLEEIIDTLRNEFPKFNEIYQNEINNFSENSMNQNNVSNEIRIQNNSSINNFGYGSAIDKLLRQEQLKINKNWDLTRILDATSITLGILSTAAAIAAAGFWSGAWFFGISIPWALASTAASVALTIAATSLGIYSLTVKNNNSNLENNYKEMEKKAKANVWWETIDDLISFGIDTWLAIKGTFELIYWTTMTLGGTITATSWAFPPVLTVSGTLMLILNLVDVLFEY